MPEAYLATKLSCSFSFSKISTFPFVFHVQLCLTLKILKRHLQKNCTSFKKSPNVVYQKILSKDESTLPHKSPYGVNNFLIKIKNKNPYVVDPQSPMFSIQEKSSLPLVISISNVSYKKLKKNLPQNSFNVMMKKSLVSLS